MSHQMMQDNLFPTFYSPITGVLNHFRPLLQPILCRNKTFVKNSKSWGWYSFSSFQRTRLVVYFSAAIHSCFPSFTFYTINSPGLFLQIFMRSPATRRVPSKKIHFIKGSYQKCIKIQAFKPRTIDHFPEADKRGFKVIHLNLPLSITITGDGGWFIIILHSQQLVCPYYEGERLLRGFGCRGIAAVLTKVSKKNGVIIFGGFNIRGHNKSGFKITVVLM